MKNIILAAIGVLVLFQNSAHAQTSPYKEWDYTITETALKSDWLLDIIQTSDDGYLSCGFADGWAHPGIIKRDQSGAAQWSYVYHQSNPLLRGSFSQAIELNDGTGYLAVGFQEYPVYGSGDRVGLLMKFDLAGNPLSELESEIYFTQADYGFSYDKLFFESIQELPVSAGGGFIIAGWSKNAHVPTESDAFLMKLNADLTFAWIQNYNNQLLDFTARMIITYDGGGLADGIVVSGFTKNTTNDVWVFKTDLSGVLQWQQIFDSSNPAAFGYTFIPDHPVGVGPCPPPTPTSDDGNRSVIQTQDGNLVVIGMFNRYTLGAGVCLAQNGEYYSEYLDAEIAMLKLDVTTGSALWAKHIEHQSGADFHAKAVEAPSGNIHVIGTSGDVGVATPGRMDDILITTTDNGGYFLWSKTMNTGNCNCGFGIDVTDDSGDGIADDGLIVCGNDDDNGDDYVIIKLTYDCALADFSAYSVNNNLSCNGAADGSVDLTPIDGLAPFTYLWSTSETTEDISSLGANIYSVTVDDACGNQTIFSTTITEPLAIPYTFTLNNITCNGVNDGSIDLVMSGTPPYTFNWSNGETTSAIINLVPGTYSVTVSDASPTCMELSFSITEPAPLLANVTGTNENCEFTDDGTATATHTGGTGPYSYLWDDATAATTPLVEDLFAGNYNVIVTDANGCTTTGSVTITEPAVLSVNITFTNETCDYNNDGTATATVTGGTGPYTFLWDDPASQTTATATGLAAGTYNVVVTDVIGCSTNLNVIISQPSALTVSTTSTDKTCDFSTNGSATANASGGTGPYTYQWNDVDLQTTQVAENLEAGLFSVTVTDNNGCTQNAPAIVNVLVPATSIPYDYVTDVNITSNTQVFADQNSDGIIKVNGLVYIEPGVNYTMSNLIVEFANNPYVSPDLGLPQSGVIVKTNAKLTMKNNTTFRGISECYNMWDGVEVWGDQFITIPPVPLEVRIHLIPLSESMLKNGKLIMNNAQIQDAHTGVALYRKNIPFSASPPVEYGRGIVEATNSRFINNHVGVAFSGFTLINNYSFIKGCTFTNDAPLIDLVKYGGEGMLSFISLSKVKKVNITANGFNGHTLFTEDKRGTTILSYDASYNVQSGQLGIPAGSPFIPNVFNNTTKGIDAFSTGGINKNILVKDNVFNNVQQGIIANGSSFDEISLNQFTVPAGTSTLNTWGIFLYGTYGYLVTENIFNTSATGPFTYGLLSRNTNVMAGEVYHNDFTGAFDVGTQMEQDNSLLQLKCNEYTNTNTYDWAVTSGNIANQGNCSVTDPTAPAGNRFDPCSTADESQIFVDPTASGFVYSTQSGIVPVCVSSSLFVVDCGTSFDEIDACPVIIDIPCGIPCISERKVIFEDAPPGFMKELMKAGLFRAMEHNEDIAGLLEILATNASDSDLRLLIATYLSYGHCQQAKETLERLSGTGIPDIKFKLLYTVLIDACEDGRTEKELTVSEKQTIRDISLMTEQFAVHAQSVLTKSDDEIYIREPEIINTNRSFFRDNTSNERAVENTSDIASLKVYPNPINENAIIEFETSEKNGVTEIIVYDLLGKIIKTINVSGNKGMVYINNEDLQQGTYYCTLLNNRQVLTKTIISVIK